MFNGNSVDDHCFTGMSDPGKSELVSQCQANGLQKSINESLEFAKNHGAIYPNVLLDVRVHIFLEDLSDAPQRVGVDVVSPVFDGTCVFGNLITYLDENKSTNHQIYEINEFYIEMVDRLKKLRLDYTEEEELIEEDSCYGGDGDSVLSEVVNAIKKKRNDPQIKRQIETILKLDLEIDENYKTLRNEKLDRISLQEQICQDLKSDATLDKHSEKLYEICKFDGGTRKQNLISNEVQRPTEDTLGGSSCKKREKSENNKFIRRNIELAKNSQEMGNLSLTDEEKIKLESLLVDVDAVADDGHPTLVTEDIDPHNTGYHFDDDERCLLDALDERLKNFGKYTETSEEIDQHSGEDKFWKMEQRLRNIEEELLSYQSEKGESLGENSDQIEAGTLVFSHSQDFESTEDIQMKIQSYRSNLSDENISSDLEDEGIEKYELETEEADDEKMRFLEVHYDEDEQAIVKRVKEAVLQDD